MINKDYYNNMFFSVAMTEKLHKELNQHLDKGIYQEDLTFALYKPSIGKKRCTAILQKVILPLDGDRILNGNVSFITTYIQRVLKEAGKEYGVAFLHSHLGPGWQGMSSDDIIAEKQRLASAVAGSTGLPLIGLTMGTDGTWSARFWLRIGKNEYERFDASTTRIIGKYFRSTFHPRLMPIPKSTDAQVATISVWGKEKQYDLARIHVGIVGIGSVGSLVAESLSRIGISHITLIDHDIIKERNLDRTLGATLEDVKNKLFKVRVSERLVSNSHTANQFVVDAVPESLLGIEGYKKALDCDIIFSCVDRPWPRHLLNAIAYAHLIPVIDGGIYAKVDNGRFVHADWRIHTICPDRPCMVCINALKSEHISLDMNGLLDDPSYIQGLGHDFKSTIARQNVFPFSMSVAAHEVLQFIGLVTGEQKIGGRGPQTYHCYPGIMELSNINDCKHDCEYSKLTATACDLSGNLKQKETN